MALTLVVGALAVVAAQRTGPYRWLHLILLVLAVVFLVAALRNLLHPKVAAIVWHADGGADITLRATAAAGERTVQGTVQAGRVLGPLVVLTLRWPPRDCAHLWLLPDNLDADTRRRLRMRLGVGGAKELASGGADSH